MDIRRAAAAAALVVAVCFAGTCRVAAQVNPPKKLWLAIMSDKPVYQLDEVPRLSISFAVVNDGNTTVNPGIEDSHLLINGVEPKDWDYVIHNGVRSELFWALPSGRSLSFLYQLGNRFFTAPGIYRVRWQVGDSWAPEITFRVMPKQTLNDRRPPNQARSAPPGTRSTRS